MPEENPTLKNLESGPKHESLVINIVDPRDYMLKVDLVVSCCAELRYHWGTLFNFDVSDKTISIFRESRWVDGIWEAEASVNYCPFCGTKLDLTQQGGDGHD